MGGSGVQRPLKFIKYLREYGWNPIVLCPEPGLYSVFDESLQKELDEIAPEIIRVKANTPFHIGSETNTPVQLNLPDSAKKITRRLQRLFMYPDNKKGWIQPAIDAAHELLSKRNIDVLFSTAPPFSNHIIGAAIKSEFDLPLVLDYRDAWQKNHFMNEMYNWQKKRMFDLEEECLKAADAIVGLDDHMLNEMQRVFHIPNVETEVIPHGYDPDDFISSEKATLHYQKGKVNFLYSGLFYEQNQPDNFLYAVKSSLTKGSIQKEDLHLHFQGGLEKRHLSLIKKLGLNDIVTSYGYLNHDIAVANITKADVLWMLSNFDSTYKQVKSGKLFEYFGAKKIIFGLVHSGQEADLIQKYGAGFVADVKSSEIIATEIAKIVRLVKSQEVIQPNPEFVSKYNRKELTRELSELFNKVSSQI